MEIQTNVNSKCQYSCSFYMMTIGLNQSVTYQLKNSSEIYPASWSIYSLIELVRTI